MTMVMFLSACSMFRAEAPGPGPATSSATIDDERMDYPGDSSSGGGDMLGDAVHSGVLPVVMIAGTVIAAGLFLWGNANWFEGGTLD